jgi:putative ABC transport system substrate-binding protein
VVGARGQRMRRREVVALLGGAAAAGPTALLAQPAAKPATIGYLGATTAATQREWTAAFVARLGEHGWVEGKNLAIEYRWAEGRSERYPEIAAEFVRLRVDAILTHGTPAILAAKRATSSIPIVFASAADPVGNGLVASLSRPGGNVTGLSNQGTDITAKRLELLRELAPRFGRLAVMGHIGNPAILLEMAEVETAARALGIDVVTMAIRRAEDIAPAFATLQGRADALFVAADPMLNANRVRINALALEEGLPTLHGFRGYVEAGGLLSYGSDLADMFRRAADHMNKILRGATPADIPVEQPTKFDLVLNLRTAKALGILIPQTILLRADALIE